MANLLKIHFPPDQDFACTACGKCCVADWRVKVHETEKAVLEKTAPYKRAVRAGFQPLVVVEEQLQLNRKEDGACYFLKNNLCEIHGEAGPRSKPAPCRLYPYQLVYTPTGYYASFSFNCPAVICGTGELSDESIDDLKQTIQDAVHFFPPNLETTGTVTISTGVKLPFDIYLNWEHQILDALRSSSKSLCQTLLASVSILADALTIGQLPTFNVEPNERVQVLYQKLTELQGTFRDIVIATLEECEDLEKRTVILSALSGAVSFHSDLLGVTVPGLEPSGVRDQLSRSILSRYAINQLWGKRLITGPTFLSRLLLLATSLEVFWFYLAGAKKAAGVLHFAPRQVEQCFDILETQLGHHHDILYPLFREWEEDLMSLAYGLHQDESSPEK